MDHFLNFLSCVGKYTAGFFHIHNVKKRHNSRRFSFVSWWNIFRQDQCVCYFLQQSFILRFKQRCQEEWFWCNKMPLQTVERAWVQDKPHCLANCVWTDNHTVTGHIEANISVIKRGAGGKGGGKLCTQFCIFSLTRCTCAFFFYMITWPSPVKCWWRVTEDRTRLCFLIHRK